jgi:hypothetical protein
MAEGIVMKTRRDLIDRALSVLGVLGSGQSPETEDVALVDGFIDPMIADLTDRDVVYISDAEEIEDGLFLDLAKVLANNCREAFGLANDPRLAATGIAAENSLREKSAQGPTYRVLRSQYF